MQLPQYLPQFRFNSFNFQNRMGCQESQLMPQPHNIFPAQPLSFEKDSEHLDGERLGDMYFKDKEFLKAIAVYQKVIEDGYKVDFDIEGLGNSDHAISRYEWFTYRWYDEQRNAGKFKGNVFDALSLCYCHIRCTNVEAAQKGIIWYEDALASHQCYELYIGYANILYGRCRYEEALKYYKKVIAIKPKIINNYVSIAMLSQYRRIEKSKSMEMAKKILQMDENNMYAHYILARNESNPDEKINKLKVVSQKFPDYVRATNDVGIAYGAKKEHRQAIVWYKKCIERAPQYAAAHNNVGVRTQLCKEHVEALVWYLKACQLDPEYKAAHGNAIDIFDHLKYSDDDILEQAKKYPSLKTYFFYYYLGLAYYDKKRVDASITWYKRAEMIKDNDYELFNSIGISYDQIKDYTNAQIYYLKCIELNPKYHNPYYNLGYLFKSQNNIEKAIEWYKKAIEVNPRYHKCYNNLANIYKDRRQYQIAVEYYKKAVESNSTYTLALVNLAVCYLSMEMYQEAFPCFEKAKQILPTDNNGMSQGNKRFLNENIANFDKEGQKWRKTGSIGLAEKQQLRALIKSFESNFKQIYSVDQSFQRKDQVVLKPEILRILRLIQEDKFELKNIDAIFALVKHVFKDNEEYFHIIPQLFIQHFWTQYQQNKPILDTESSLFKLIGELSKKQSSTNVEERPSQTYDLDVKMKNFNPPSDAKVNLFKETTFFNSYEILYSELVKVNKLAEQSLPQFIDFVENVRKRSNGIPYGVNMKLPKRPEQQFKVILRILEKMFKKEINAERVNKIIQKIEKQLRAGGKNITLLTIVHEIMDVWTQEITNILKERTNSKVQTTCGISDLVRGKIMFDNVEDLRKAIDACDKLCHLRGYEIIELDNRLTKPQTMDVVLKIKVNEAICEFQLAMRQNESKYHFIHSIYEIERSPLGCIFGSYLFMSKGFNYPILANCKDIEERLKVSEKEEDKAAVAAAQYVINCLEEKEQTA